MNALLWKWAPCDIVKVNDTRAPCFMLASTGIKVWAGDNFTLRLRNVSLYPLKLLFIIHFAISN